MNKEQQQQQNKLLKAIFETKEAPKTSMGQVYEVTEDGKSKVLNTVDELIEAAKEKVIAIHLVHYFIFEDGQLKNTETK